jgi:hypothetical protein
MFGGIRIVVAPTLEEAQNWPAKKDVKFDALPWTDAVPENPELTTAAFDLKTLRRVLQKILMKN